MGKKNSKEIKVIDGNIPYEGRKYRYVKKR